MKFIEKHQQQMEKCKGHGNINSIIRSINDTSKELNFSRRVKNWTR
jgi:hypothetical protein